MCSNIKREEYKENPRAGPLLGLLSRGAASAGVVAVSLRNGQCHAPGRQSPARSVAPAAAPPALARHPAGGVRGAAGAGGEAGRRRPQAASGGAAPLVPAPNRAAPLCAAPRRSAVLQPAAVGPPAPAAGVSWWPGQEEQERQDPSSQGRRSRSPDTGTAAQGPGKSQTQASVKTPLILRDGCTGLKGGGGGGGSVK